MRVYSPTKQARDQDPDGSFIRKYVPELARVPLKYLHEPSKMPLDVQMRAGVMLVPVETLDSRTSAEGLSYYPLPIVDEAQSARSAKERLGEIKRQLSTKKEADAVLKKHGSRKRAASKRPRAPAGVGGAAKEKQKQRLITAFTKK